MNSSVTALALVAFVVPAAPLGCAAQEGVRDGAERASTDEATPASVSWTPEVPQMSTHQWQLEDWAASDPVFPWLPGEDRERSRSIGGVTHGWLVNAVRIPRPHPHLAVLPVQAGRDHDYTTQEMLDLVESAAAHVAEAHPGTVLYLGNFSAEGGGDIPQSVSHNSGRDADLSFYFADASGEQIEPPDLVPVADDGTYTAPDGTEYVFDVERNWKLVEGLVEAGRGRIQYVFVSSALRKMLLDHARDVDADASVIRHAGVILGQPGGALPHNDHFHVRIYCSATDVRSGCTDRGSRVPGYDSHNDERRDAVATASRLLDDERASVRVAAVRRLGLLRAKRKARDIAARLGDDEPRVRAAAARVLGQFGRREASVREQLAHEKDPRVRAEIVWALGEYGTDSATNALASLLDEPRPVEIVDGQSVDLRVLAADVLAMCEDPEPVPALIAITAGDDPNVRARAHRALTMLTNHDPNAAKSPPESLHEAWTTWWKENENKSRDAWLIAGFKRRGFDVDALNLHHVWELTAPILSDDYLSYNAQRVLMRLSRRNPPSLDWPKSDANFYWRRWFERRWKRLGCPPVPDGLSTLD